MHGYIVVTTRVFWRVLHVLGNFFKLMPTNLSPPLGGGQGEGNCTLEAARGVGVQRGGESPDPEFPAAEPRLCCIRPVFRHTEALCASPCATSCACVYGVCVCVRMRACVYGVCVCTYICVYRPEEAQVSMFHVCVLS